MTTTRQLTGGTRKSPLTISVTSGKGGVGKTLTTVNMAIAARRLGLSVLIFDGDLGLANVDVVLGLSARYNIRDVLDGHASLSDVIVEGPMGIHLIPSGSGVSSLSQLTHVQKQQIFEQIARVEDRYDILLIDTGAGISSNVMHLNQAADQVLVVTTPEPHAMTDAYALIKVLTEEWSEKGRPKSLNLLVNMARSDGEGLKVYERIAEVAMRFLNVQVAYAGHVPLDPSVPKAVIGRRAASEQSSHTIAGQAWTQIARKLMDSRNVKTRNANVQEFWRNLMWDETMHRTRAQVGM